MDYTVFDTFPELNTDRLMLRLHTKEDADDILELRSDPDVMKYMDQHPPKDKTEVLANIKEIHKDFKDKKGINWTIKLKGSTEAIGYMSFWRIDHSNHRLEMGYALKKSHWNKGIAIEAGKAAIDFAFEKLKAHSIMANINPKNIASEALLQKLGFQKEAYFRENYHFDGQFLDSAIYCLLKSDLK